MSKGKISVRRELREPDAFVKTTYSALDYVNKHRKLISIAAVILIAVGVASIGSFWYISDRNKNARQLLNQALLVMEQQPEAAAEDVEKPLQTIVANYDGTAVGPVASYLIANQQYRSGKLDEAAAAYRNNSGKLDPHLRDLQRFGAATIDFQQKKYSDAITVLEQMQTEQSFLNEDLYILLGLSYEKSNQPDKAIATYENMIQLLQNSSLRPWAEERLLSLRNRATS